MTHLYQALATKVEEWRQGKYPCDDYPAIREILEYAIEDEESGQLRYLRRAQFRALETYWYLRLVLNTPKIPELYEKLYPKPKERREAMGLTHPEIVSFIAGTQGGRLVKIVPFNHPLTPLDMEALRNELKTRPDEERDVMLVSLGIEQSARKWMEEYNRNRPVNKLHLVELRTDRKYGGIIKHEPMSADIAISREADKLIVEIRDVVSPTIIQRLNLQEGVFRAQIADWRAVVDCVLIDTQYNGELFNIALSDVPERKQDLVNGRYELPAPLSGSTVAVKIIDMLGEEAIVTYQVG